MLKRFGLALFASLDAVICSASLKALKALFGGSSFRWRRRLRFSCPLSFAFCGGNQALVFFDGCSIQILHAALEPLVSSKSSARTARCSSTVTFRPRVRNRFARPPPVLPPPPASTVTGAGVVPAGGV